MENYYFLYKDSVGTWKQATNPMFIAEHKHCRALPKNVVHENLKYVLVADLIYDLNNDKLSSKQHQILIEFHII